MADLNNNTNELLDVLSLLDGKAIGGGSNYTLPVASTDVLGGIKAGEIIKVDEEGEVSIDAASAANAGLMSAADKTKLDGIAAGANKYTLPDAEAAIKGGIYVKYVSETGTLYLGTTS
jgi:hypothetical protein